LGTFVNKAGAGATATTFALYFTRIVGLAPRQVGIALSVSALLAMVLQVPLGHLGDIRGPREVMSLLTLASGVAGTLLVVVRNFWVLALVLAMVTTAQRGSASVRDGYVARVAAGADGVAFKAYLRAVTNLAMSVGAAFGGVALWLDRRWIYVAVLTLDAMTSVFAGMVSLRLPHIEVLGARTAGDPRMAVLRDVPYVLLTVLAGVVSLHFVVMELGVPLWIATHTAAPRALAAALLVLNTMAVALLQVRMTVGIDGVRRSARAMAHGGLWIAGGMAVVATSGLFGPPGAVVVLLLGAAAHVVGEMRSSAGQWGVQMGLAPQERQGQYQGFAGLSLSFPNMVGPALVTMLCIEWGWQGWLVFGSLILGSSLLIGPTAAWAARTRGRYGASSATC
jgi:MFS family permease